MATTDTDTGSVNLAEMSRDELVDAVVRSEWNYQLAQESLTALEMSLRDEIGWRRLDSSFTGEFSRDGLARIIQRSRYAYLGNPLINHALEVQAHYVAGQGVDVAAQHPAVNDVLRDL